MTSCHKSFFNKLTKNTLKFIKSVEKCLKTYQIEIWSQLFESDKHISEEFFASQILLHKNVLCTIIDKYGHFIQFCS